MVNNKRLIDANALGRDAFHIKQFGKGIRCVVDWDDVENAPIVDAVEVVHGEWEITEDDYLSLVEMKCSVCGESYGFEWFEDYQPKNYHYCPNCGAKMDGDSE